MGRPRCFVLTDSLKLRSSNTSKPKRPENAFDNMSAMRFWTQGRGKDKQIIIRTKNKKEPKAFKILRCAIAYFIFMRIFALDMTSLASHRTAHQGGLRFL